MRNLPYPPELCWLLRIAGTEDEVFVGEQREVIREAQRQADQYSATCTVLYADTEEPAFEFRPREVSVG